MKIITKTVIDINTLETLEEKSFEYEGEIALCGGSGGGGGSGKVDFPDYMKDFHEALLNNNGDVPYNGQPISQVLEDSISDNPLVSAVAYDPSGEINKMFSIANNQLNYADNMDAPPSLDYEAAMDSLSDTSTIDSLNDTSTIDNIYNIDDITTSDGIPKEIFDLTTTVLPRFEAGMRDIGAVQSSAFIQGRANLSADYASKVASRLTSEAAARAESRAESKANIIEARDEARVKASEARAETRAKILESRAEFKSSTAAQFALNKAKLRDASVGKIIEVNRMAVEAFNTQTDRNIEIDTSESTWGLQMYKYAGNLLGAVQGNQTPQGGEGPSQAKKAIGAGLAGAASGAVIGAEIGGPQGAAIGAGIGAAVGVGSTYL